MLAKTWKKIGLIILIIACLWNIVGKLVHRISFDNAIELSLIHISEPTRRS